MVRCLPPSLTLAALLCGCFSPSTSNPTSSSDTSSSTATDGGPGSGPTTEVSGATSSDDFDSSDSGGRTGGNETTSTSTDPATCTSDADCGEDRPFCGDDSHCVSCADRNADACLGLAETTPVCGSTGACVGCRGHFDCPGTACHLDGPMGGACFLASEVATATTADELAEILAAGPGETGSLVIRLGPQSMRYATADDAFYRIDHGEVAIIGSGIAQTSLDVTPGSDTSPYEPLLVIGSDATVYLGGIDMGTTDSEDVVRCNGGRVFFDQVRTRDEGYGLTAADGCIARVRSSHMSAMRVLGGTSSTTLQASSLWLLILEGGEFNASYATIYTAGDYPQNLLSCVGGRGSLRNSIMARGAGTGIQQGCEEFAFERVASTGDPLPGDMNVGIDDVTTLFVGAPNDLHLAAGAPDTVLTGASWSPGDPERDIDGEPIPREMPSAAGFDQP